MSGAPIPPRLLEAIASAASSGFITNPMPDAPTGTNAASVQGGFPPITMESELAGGEPPLGQDMNGYLFLISSHTMWLQCGQPYRYDATLAADIGGYALGTVLGMLSGFGLWLNTSAGNTSNPDTGGAGWTPIASAGRIDVGGLTNVPVTLTAAQWQRKVIVFGGALTANVTITFPTIDAQQWLVVNDCTGAHILTVKTAGGSGVAIPAGGAASPQGIYCDGTNIQFSTTPLTVPIDQAATPSTLAERDSAGNIFATGLNTSATIVNPAVGAFFVEDTAADGFLRKISPANILSSVFKFLASFNGSNGSFSLLGLTIKWGTAIAPLSQNLVTTGFTAAFANNCWGVWAQPQPAGGGGTGFSWVTNVTRVSFDMANSLSSATVPTYWFAIGN